MYSAQDIAKWFLYKNYAEQKAKMASNDDYEVYDGITHLKLQKLLYAIKRRRIWRSDSWNIFMRLRQREVSMKLQED